MMSADPMDCFLTYNLSCINGTLAQLNASSVIFGDALDPHVLSVGETAGEGFLTSSQQPVSTSSPASILISVEHCIITAIILGAIILSTIAGNILVIAAIVREKSLHSVAYYLFVSLAVADLMVASMVMPIAVLKEVTRSWVLGSIICDAWVTIDLLCCTASILHLVAIALDRYWAITNLDYATKRTAGRILLLISVIWVTSILIASSHLFPIFRDERGRPADQCRLAANVPYTIISTVGAFYIPLIGMCIIYWKIFQAAKFRIRRKAFNTNNHSTPTALGHSPPGVLSSPSSQANHGAKRFSLPNRLKFLKRTRPTSRCSNDIEADNPSNYSSSGSHHQHDYQMKSLKKTTLSLLTRKQAKPVDDEFQQSANQSVPSTRRLITSTGNHDLSIPVNTISNPLASSTSSLSGSSRFNETHVVVVVTDTQQTIVTKSSTPINRKKIDIKRERKATKVLGVVMGCFILCWLPFFLEETICGIFHLTINEKIISVLTWLGFLNSLLNPVIYTIFAPDFRQAFGKILFGRYRKRRRLKT